MVYSDAASVGGWSSSIYSGSDLKVGGLVKLKVWRPVIGWSPRVTCGRVRTAAPF